MNVSFQGLKGLSELNNSKILRKMGRKMQEGFTEPAKEAFANIHNASGKKDVFIKLEEKPSDTRGHYTSYRISVNDALGNTIAKTSIFYSPSFTNGSIHEECSDALNKLANNFNLNNPVAGASDDIDEMINNYA